MSKSATILGLLFGIIIISLNMVDFSSGKILTSFFNWQGLLVVLGGTLAALLINYPLNQFVCIFKSFGKVFASEPPKEDEVIEKILELSQVASKRGLLILEKEIDFIDDSFLKFAITSLMIYRDEKTLRAALENYLNAMRMRHLTCQDVFNNMASYAPAFGMMGTVMGLIMMMTTQLGGGDAAGGQNVLSGLLQGMGLALVTTFYGVLFSNFIFMPIAGKLRLLSDMEMSKNALILEGILSIKREESPLLLKEILLVFVNEQIKRKVELMT